jgi:glycosyltransferase 2 family protein
MKKVLKYSISIIITIIVFYLISTQITLTDVINVLKKTNPLLLFLGFLFYIVMMVFRTIRFDMLLNNKINFKTLFSIVMLHSFFNNILPVRTGEFSYVYYLKKKKIPVKKGLSSLLIARVFDFIVLITVMIVFIIFSNNLPNKEIFSKLIPWLLLSLFLIISLAFSLIFMHKYIIKFLKRFEKITPKFIHDKIEQFILSFSNYKSKKVLILTFFYGLLIYLLGTISNYFSIVSLGFYLPLNILIIAITFSVLSSVLPINGIASFGTMEAVWVLILGYFGYSTKESLLLSFSLHIILILFSTISGLIGYLLFNFLSNNKNTSS